jgi:hypothetical protein
MSDEEYDVNQEGEEETSPADQLGETAEASPQEAEEGVTPTTGTAAPLEILPEKKPLRDEVLVDLRQSEPVRVLLKDSGLPPWLRYIISDDIFYFNREVDGPPQPPVVAADGAHVEVETSLPTNVANTPFVLSANSDGSYSAYATEPDAGAVSKAPVVEPNGNSGKRPEETQEDAADEKDDTAGAVTGDAPADVVSNDTRSSSQPDIIIDALTLAALFSRDVLKRFMRHPTTTFSTLQSWIIGQGATDAMLENIAEAKSGDAKLRLKIDYNPFFLQLRNDLPSGNSWKYVISTFARAGLHASKPIDTSLLVTPQLVLTYAQLLMLLPRSQVLAWTQPKREGDEERSGEDLAGQPLSYLLGNTLLELRRREARCVNGRPSLKVSASAALKKFLPANPALVEETLDDVPLSNDYAARTYFPPTLYLWQSDVALLAIGLYAQHEELLPVFKELLGLKLRKARRHDDNSGTFHLLYNALPLMRLDAGQHVIFVSPAWRLFTNTGQVNAAEYATSAAAELAAKEPRLVAAFARKFFLELSTGSQGGNASQLAVLEKSAPAVSEAILLCQRSYERLYSEIANGQASAATLDAVVASETLDESTVFSPLVLYQAIVGRNYSVLKHLVASKNVVTVQRDVSSNQVDVLEAALDTADPVLLRHVVECGVSLNTVIHHGLHSGLSLVQTLAEGQFDAALELWRAVERNRVADPTKKHGLLRNVMSH